MGGSVSQVANIANHILDSFTTDKPLRSHKVNQRVPSVFVEKGSYTNGKITLNIINKFGANYLTFTGNIRKTELSSEENMIKTVSLTGAYKEQITIDTGYLFDIGFSITAANSSQLDALYLADGPWGIDYLEQGVQIDTFTVTAQDKETQENNYAIERNATVQGTVKETINLFRNTRNILVNPIFIIFL